MRCLQPTHFKGHGFYFIGDSHLKVSQGFFYLGVTFHRVYFVNLLIHKTFYLLFIVDCTIFYSLSCCCNTTISLGSTKTNLPAYRLEGANLQATKSVARDFGTASYTSLQPLLTFLNHSNTNFALASSGCHRITECGLCTLHPPWLIPWPGAEITGRIMRLSAEYSAFYDKQQCYLQCVTVNTFVILKNIIYRRKTIRLQVLKKG